ncbi:hypothetical protein OIDMADRAFT_183564 [Oidiodendron maius Zn]|uniref:Uncharacterized protein n=1 Tax=Oidiodendron maius (strain Zn) TaxID=913774 RepID=A0A0C3H0Z2_OIDMZ|nr:hypothetical protein OIDMADRAFT_183564 [Oidiodendron maius Zn]
MKFTSLLLGVASISTVIALPIVSAPKAREAHMSRPWHKFGIGANTIFVTWGAYADYPRPDEYNSWKEKKN